MKSLNTIESDECVCSLVEVRAYCTNSMGVDARERHGMGLGYNIVRWCMCLREKEAEL